MVSSLSTERFDEVQKDLTDRLFADCQIIIFDTEDAARGVACVRANIDVGNEPVAYCLISPDGQTVLSCDDEGQLETWSVEKGESLDLSYCQVSCKYTSMFGSPSPPCLQCPRDSPSTHAATILTRFETGHASVLASFALEGSVILSCADFEAGLIMVDVQTAEVLEVENFSKLEEGRNKSAYAISPTGSLLIAYVKEQTWGNNLVIYDAADRTSRAVRVCDGAALHVEFR